MNKYDIIFEALQEKLENGELTMEEAEALNDAAYNRYVTEDKSDLPAQASGKIEADRIKSMGGHNPSLKNIYKSKQMKDSIARDPSMRAKLKSSYGLDGKEAYYTAKGANKEFTKMSNDKVISSTSKKIMNGDLTKAPRELADKSNKAIETGKKYAKKALRQESVEITDEGIQEIKNDLKLSVYEAADAGFFTNDEMSVLFELID